MKIINKKNIISIIMNIKTVTWHHEYYGCQEYKKVITKREN